MTAKLSDTLLHLAAMALPLLLFATVGIVAMLRRGRAAPTEPPVVAADGTITVPVRALYLRHGGVLGATSRNSLNPRFAIAPDGIRFKVFRESRLPYAHIDHLDVRKGFGRTHLLFVSDTAPRVLSVDVGDAAMAKHVLDALPRSLALTPEAATIRDGVPDAGTAALRRYSGRVA